MDAIFAQFPGSSAPQRAAQHPSGPSPPQMTKLFKRHSRLHSHVLKPDEPDFEDFADEWEKRWAAYAKVAGSLTPGEEIKCMTFLNALGGRFFPWTQKTLKKTQRLRGIDGEPTISFEALFFAVEDHSRRLEKAKKKTERRARRELEAREAAERERRIAELENEVREARVRNVEQEERRRAEAAEKDRVDAARMEEQRAEREERRRAEAAERARVHAARMEEQRLEREARQQRHDAVMERIRAESEASHHAHADELERRRRQRAAKSSVFEVEMAAQRADRDARLAAGRERTRAEIAAREQAFAANMEPRRARVLEARMNDQRTHHAARVDRMRSAADGRERPEARDVGEHAPAATSVKVEAEDATPALAHDANVSVVR